MRLSRKRFFRALAGMLCLTRWTPTSLARAATGAEEPPIIPRNVLNEASKLAEEGRFEEALQKHIWYHENALKFDEGQYGVRLSYALRDWTELGKKYPKALKALTDIRAKDVATLRDGRGDARLFHDVVAIDRYLAGPRQGVDLFKWIDAHDPSLAAKCYGRAEEVLADAGEYRLCGKYLKDPLQSLDFLKSNWKATRQFEEEPRPTGRKPPPIADKSFTERTVRIITILVRNDRKAEAERFRDEALKIVDAPAIREAVEKAAEPAKAR